MFIDINEQFKIKSIATFIFDRVFSNDFVFDGEMHDYWEIVYIIEGKIEVVESNEIYIMNKGDMIFHAPMEFHRLRTVENSSPHVLNISLKIDGALPENLKDGVFSLNSEERRKYLEIFYYFKDVFLKGSDRNFYTTQKFINELTAFFINLSENVINSSNVSSIESAMKYKSLVKIMNEGVDKNYTIDDLAKQLFISKSYIKSLFITYSGISPKTYYNKLRILRAKELVKEYDSVGKISEIMNFSSCNHFIRFFKRYTDSTPLQFKKQLSK